MISRFVNATCRYVSDLTGARVSYELRLRVTGRTDEQVAEAAILDCDVRAAALSRELKDQFRPLDDSEGVFVEVNDA